MSTEARTSTDRALNLGAELVPGSPYDPDEQMEGLPAIRVDDVLVFVYVDRDDEDRRVLRVSVDLDDVSDPELIYGDQSCVRMRVCIQGGTVFAADEDGERRD